MKKLGLVLLVTACLQQGLVTDPKAVTEDDDATTGGTTGTPVETKPQIELLKKSSTQFLKTIFGNKSLSSTQPVVGFGNGGVGEAFCFSNENETNGSTFDSLVNCRRPLESEDLPAEENDLLEVLTQETGRTNAKGLAFVTQALQFYFSNTPTAPTDNYYSIINSGTMKLSIKTAPIEFNATSGEFSWDSTRQTTIVYAGSSTPCSLSNQNTVGFDIGNDSSLGTSDERKKYFVTGLWVFERGETKPYETATTSPIGEYSGASSGPAQLFSTRTNIFGSLLIPLQDEDTKELGFHYFPGDNSSPTNAPSATASPYKYTSGLYRQSFVPANQATEIDTSFESTIKVLTGTPTVPFDGAIITPVMGKYDGNNEVSANGVSWKNRVVTGLCISGVRTLYAGSATAVGSYPLIHALKYELRKIKVVVK